MTMRVLSAFLIILGAMWLVGEAVVWLARHL